ncbi:MAG TPA: lipopolysaccharide biosynthesis protein [Gaiellaceae bacterium]|nr:lipopolysaccharide biosynthesis protein [Gaiellaceae bacterium]
MLGRRSVTAAGVYTATVLGFATSVVATRVLGAGGYARYATVMAAVGFFQLLLDLTIDEALIKYGFRYTTTEDWGRLRRLFAVALGVKVSGGALGMVGLLVLAPLSSLVWPHQHLAWPLLVGAFVPLAQAAEGVAGGALILRGRYDVRGAFYAVAMALRLAGTGVGAVWGVTAALLGLLAAQVVATAAISAAGLAAFRRFPARAAVPLGDDGRDVRNFVVQSTVASSVTSARGILGTMLIGVVAPFRQAAYFRNAQAPLTAFGALSAPARLVLLAEQTSDFERGDRARVLRMLRRYIAGTTVAMAVAVPAGWVLMPWLMGVVYGRVYRVHAADAGRLVLVTGALQLIYGWSKTLPVTIGRPGLRIVTHGVEALVFVPALVVFAALWGATGGAAALLVSTIAFCAVWTVLLARIRRDLRRAPS